MYYKPSAGITLCVIWNEDDYAMTITSFVIIRNLLFLGQYESHEFKIISHKYVICSK